MNDTDSLSSSITKVEASRVSTCTSSASTIVPQYSKQSTPKVQQEDNKSDSDKPSWIKSAFTRKEPPAKGKERWMDASLPDKERWKDWHKAKEREYAQSSGSRYYTSFFKKSWAWWL